MPLLLVAWGAGAHHSRANFELDVLTELRGTVTEYSWNNPHTFVTMDIANEAGVVEEWLLELNSISVLTRLGWNRDTLNAGDEVTVFGNRDKGSVYQGGIHIPMLIAGPGIANRGDRSDALVHTSDIFSTVLDLAGAEMTPGGVPASIPPEIVIDGRSVVPTLSGEPIPGRRYVLAEGGAVSGNPAFDEQPRYGGRETSAIRNERYKLTLATVLDENRSFICLQDPQPTAENPVPCGRDERVKSYELYDLQSDPRESNDLLANGVEALDARTRAIFEELRDAVPRVRAGWR